MALLLMAMSCAPKDLPAVTPADFYKGKTIDLIINSSPGGSTDRITRMIASYLGRDAGANIVVTNRKGAGGMEGMNYLYRGKPDGLTMGTTPSGTFIGNKVLKEPAAVYDIEKFSYIMSIGRELQYFFVSPEGPYQSIADLQTSKDLKIGGSSPSGLISLGGLTVIELLGLDAKVITGISGESNRALAVKRGEIIGYVSIVPSTAGSVAAGMVKPMFVLATKRGPLMPDVPAITELVNLTGEDLALVKLWETVLVSSTLFATSPGIPENRLEFLRSLANKWVQDEGFREEINLVSGYEIQKYTTGDEVTKAMVDLAVALNEFQAIFVEMIEKYRA